MNYQIGQRIGKFVVLDIEKKSKYPYTVACDCGCVVKKKSSSIKENKLGCKKCALVEITKLATNSNKSVYSDAAINKLIRNYRRSAKKRGYVFDLTKNTFLEITSSNCFYCGSSPSRSVRNIDNRLTNGDYLYNGIDRKDNLIGYVLTNCVPCCTVCNMIKRDLHLNDFLSQVAKIQNHQLSNA